MSWLYSQVLVAEYSEANSLAGAPSALSSASPTPQAYSSPDRMTAFYRLSRFGMTLANLRRNDQWRGRIDVVSGGFPCQDIISSRQRRRNRRRTQRECGSTWRESLVEVRPRYRVRGEQSPMLTNSRTWTLYSETLAALGYDARGGACWAQSMPARLIGESRIWIVAERPKAREWREPEGLAAGTTQRFAKLNNRGADAINVAHSDSGRGHQDSSLCKLCGRQWD
jgi:hypothetical protein